MMNANYDQIKGYLLGDLSTEECEKIDLRIIEDDDFAVEALAAEDLLIESYIDGELSEADAMKFRSNYLINETRARQVKEFVALRAAASAIANRPAERPQKKNDASKWSLAALFENLRPVTAFAVPALIAVVGFAVWFYVSDRGITPLEREYAALNQADMGDLNQFASFSKIQLTPGAFRGGAQEARVATGTLTEGVLFRLPLTFDPAPWAKFDATLLQEGKTIFRVEEVRPFTDGDGSEVRLLLPREAIKRGQYQISLSQRGQNLSPVVFGFTAE